MLDKSAPAAAASAPSRPAADFQEHLAELERRGLLVRIERPIDKDTELHPLVRWQFLGGVAGERAARLPVHQRDRRQGPALRHAGRGRRARGLAGNLRGRHGPQGRGDRRGLDARDRQSDCAGRWLRRRRARRSSSRATNCASAGGGLAALPVPVSTPGFDSAPYLTATLCVTRDPDSRRPEHGHVPRGAESDRPACGAHGGAARRPAPAAIYHWLKYHERREPMPIAIVIGAAPVVVVHRPAEACHRSRRARRSPARLAGEPIRMVKAKTVDLMVPADAEIVIEGLIDPREARARGAVRREQRLCGARSLQHADAGDRDHAQAQAGVLLDHQPGDAERIERDQEGRLRAAVPRAPARAAFRSRASAASSCTSGSPICAR